MGDTPAPASVLVTVKASDVSETLMVAAPEVRVPAKAAVEFATVALGVNVA